MNDGIEEPKRRENFSAEELDGGWISWNLKDKDRFNSFIEPLSVRSERPTEDGRPRARVRMLPERRHSNLGDNVHGAVTLALPPGHYLARRPLRTLYSADEFDVAVGSL